MKALLCTLIMLSTLMSQLLSFPITTTFATSQKAEYGYLASPTTIYSKTQDSYDSLFTLSATYFVELIEQTSEYTQVAYHDIIGYVKTSSYEKVDYVPKTKYPNHNARLKSSIASVYMYADSRCATPIYTIGASDNIFLYGTTSTENVYYCKVGTTAIFNGYVKGEGLLITLAKDNVIEAMADDPEPEPEVEEEQKPLAFPLEIILIVCLTIPAFLAVFLLTKKKDKPQ